MYTGTQPIRVLIAGDDTSFKDSLRDLIGSNRAYDVVAQTSTAQAVGCALEHVPDVLLLDSAASPAKAFDALTELGDRTIRIRPILLTASLDRVQTVRALQLGARAVLARESTPELLDEAIEAVSAGRYWIGRNSSGDLVSMLKRLGARADRALRRPVGSQ